MTRKLTDRETKSALNHIRYKVSKNPLFIWQEIKEILENGESVPKWTRDYLAEVAEALLSIEKAGQGAEKVTMDALGMHSGRVYKEFHKERLRSQVYWMVEEEKKRRKRGEIDSKKGDVYADIGEIVGKSNPSIKGYYHEEKSAIKALDDLGNVPSPEEIVAVFKKIFFS